MIIQPKYQNILLDEEFFTVIGEHTPKEELIFRVLRGAIEEFRKMGRR